MTSTATWYAAAPSELRSERRTLDLGLRPALRHYTDLVVPGLGRVWFVRQLSWAVAGLRLSTEPADDFRRHSPTSCALGIEALACKLAYEDGAQLSRVIGTRAFARDENDPDTRSFQALTQREHYVLNSYRSGTVRALTSAAVGARPAGLGFSHGSRFSAMVLTPPGDELAGAFLEIPAGKSRVRDHLRRWIGGGTVPTNSPALCRALHPQAPTATERKLVAHRLVHVDSLDARKRGALARLLVRHSDPPPLSAILSALRRGNAERRQQADEIVLAFAFGAMLERAQRLIGAVTVAMERNLATDSAVLVRRAAVREAVGALREAARDYARLERDDPTKGHATAHRFANRLESLADPALLQFVASRDGKIVRAGDSGEVVCGPLFTTMLTLDAEQDADDDGATDPEAKAGGRTFGLSNLHSLARDLGAERLG
jgi:hypothetical protein